MSKKDYQAIARAIYTASQTAMGPEDGVDGAVWMNEQIARNIADVMAADSPRFDRARFIEACETGSYRGMRKSA